MRLKALDEQVVVITGASSGIGLETARRAAAKGASVFLIARGGTALATIVDDIVAAGGAAGFAVADVGDRAALQAAADAAVARFGRIDTWVNNAGVAIYAPLLETPFDEHARMFRTNYFGAVNGAQVAVPHLEKSRGALITVGSIAGDMPSPMMGAYAASKHALHAFVASLRIELRAAGTPVSVSLVKPSGIATPIARHAANHQAGEARIPPPAYHPALVADAILGAATRPVRAVTVGGIGRAEVLFAAHFAPFFERLAPLIVPFLSDRSKRSTPGNALFAPIEDGAARSPDESGRRVSVYAGITGRRAAAAVALGLSAVLATAWVRRTRPRAHDRGAAVSAILD